MNRKTEDKNQKLRKATKQLRKKNPKTDQIFKSKTVVIKINRERS